MSPSETTYIPSEDDVPLVVLDDEYRLATSESPPPLHGSYERRNVAQRSLLFRWASYASTLTNCRHAHCNAHPLTPRAILCRYIRRPFWGFVILLGLLNIVSISLGCLFTLFPDDFDDRLDAWLLPNSRLSAISQRDTRGIPVSRCHSHNDYWRDVPLHSALQAGCMGVEADIWLSDQDLLVGHNPFVLNRRATLRSLYLNPLLDILHQRNSHILDLPDDFEPTTPLAGVFAADPTQTLILLIDFKTDGDELWPYVMYQLQPLREAGYLTFYNGTAINERPITIVASGNAPIHQVITNDSYRDIFYDAPLDKLALTSPTSDQDQLSIEYDFSNSYYASVNFGKTIGGLHRNRFSEDQLIKIRSQIENAHSRGLKVRYWGTPSWPRGLRNHVWHVLVREGVDLLNVDDLREGTRQDWRKHRSWLL
ncbi:hypothetical protein UA08_08925 [Talaromyces atroroseus]|uniref:Altered inheritance of mitochondria protein 6 n=1 Tax=Talaromyces atroroseus TaxID=1441469 RepID=A0A225AJZ5_TALAT|nr:hypothetical protein UA08_08925 [Talaromyces atroroseus]OKL55839.1 hypothetical protein UA08_08925 [Talaromyces atroroseus]